MFDISLRRFKTIFHRFPLLLKAGKGGAIFCKSCEIKETDGAANTAAQCNDIYYDTAGSCGIWNIASG